MLLICTDVLLYIWGAHHNSIRSVEMLLLNNDIKANMKDSLGRTPFMIAAEQRNLQILKLFMKHSVVDINMRDIYSSTALHLAFKPHLGLSPETSIDVAKFLLELGANKNAQDKHGDTPLHHALKFRDINKDVPQFLLEQPAIDVTLVNKNNESPLDLAIEALDESPVKVITQNVSVAAPVKHYFVRTFQLNTNLINKKPAPPSSQHCMNCCKRSAVPDTELSTIQLKHLIILGKILSILVSRKIIVVSILSV